MKYNEWRDELKSNLLGVGESERQRVLDYYAEAYADRREAGFSEREIIEEFGAPYDAAQRILAETPKTELEAAPEKAPAPSPAPQPLTEQSKIAPTLPVAAYVAQQTAAPAPAKAKSNKGWIIGLCVSLAIIFVLLAIILPVRSACRAQGLKFTKGAYEASEEATALNINVNAGTVKTEFYDGDCILIEYPVADKYKASVHEEDGVLTYTAKLKKIPFWVSYSIPDAVIKIPQGKVVDITAKMNAGSVYLADGKFNNLNLTVNAGEIELNVIECTALSANVDAGSICAKQITCPALTCEVNMGEIEILKLTCDSLKAEVNMGSLAVGMTGAKSEYNISANCDMGSSNIGNQTVEGAEKKIEVSVNMGDLEVMFDK